MYLGFIFIAGILIGSFLNVCIYRLPLGKSIVFPASHCMKCGQKLTFSELIPVVSYFLLQGKCRHCGQPYSSRYVLIECLTGCLFAFGFAVFGISDLLIKYCILTAFLIVITFIDYDHQLVLDKLLIWFAGTGVVIHFLGQDVDVFNSLAGALAGGGILLVLARMSRGGMGGGDVKFAAIIGLWLGWKLTLLCLLLAFILGGLVGMLLIFLRRKHRKAYIAFGPFLSVGMFISMVYGASIIFYYTSEIARW